MTLPGGGSPRDCGRRSVAGGAKRGGGRDSLLFDQSARPDPADALRVICCVDDTDDLSATTSTGAVAEEIARLLPSLGGRVVLGITRHQLLLAPGVPYTSHNSAMCFEALMPRSSYERFIPQAEDVIRTMSVEGSDPGMCLVCPDRLTSAIPSPVLGAPGTDMGAMDSAAAYPAEGPTALGVDDFLAFGQAAKRRPCTKEEAYAIAAASDAILLREYGGTGDGVIGALAGAALRLAGNDGHFRGMWNLAELCATPISQGNVDGRQKGAQAAAHSHSAPARAGASAATLPALLVIEALEPLVGGPVDVIDRSGSPLPREVRVSLVKRDKPVLVHSKLSFMCRVENGIAFPLEKAGLDDMAASNIDERLGLDCPLFEPDNDPEEREIRTGSEAAGCMGCLHRRWTANGFSCLAKPGSHDASASLGAQC